MGDDKKIAMPDAKKMDLLMKARELEEEGEKQVKNALKGK